MQTSQCFLHAGLGITHQAGLSVSAPGIMILLHVVTGRVQGNIVHLHLSILSSFAYVIVDREIYVQKNMVLCSATSSLCSVLEAIKVPKFSSMNV